VAVLKRNENDPKDDYKNRIRAKQWELPVLEAVYTPGEK
jgi:hypothetical protein